MKIVAGTYEEFLGVLRASDIPVGQYGKGEAKTVRHLFEEIRAGECELWLEEGRFIRQISVVGLNITKDGFVLREESQTFYEGWRTRKRVLESSTGEKIRPGELPEETLTRLIYEEFPFLKPVADQARALEPISKVHESSSFPGVLTKYKIFVFEIEILEELPAFVVMEPDKFVQYVWVAKAE